jgi:glycosyltransferase involved in cell wall biosynthesis
MRKMKKAFIYPITGRFKSEIYSPYLDNFISFNNDYFSFLNKDDPSKIGLFNIIKYINKIDSVFFNWIEKLPDFKGGYVQSIFLFMLLAYCKLKKIKIVWTLHNRIAHSKKHWFLKKLIFRTMMKHSDFIITHAKEGIDLINEYTCGKCHIIYFPHPVTGLPLLNSKEKNIDILIWGTIVPYKGVEHFLDFIYNKGLSNAFNIRIIGKSIDSEYLTKITIYSSSKIKIEDRYLEVNELQELIGQSRIVLFTYSSDSILSSGALAESLAYGALVVGPHKGAFKDTAELGYSYTYKTFDELLDLINLIRSENKTVTKEKYEKFLGEFQWSEFARKLNYEINHVE